MSSLNCFLSKRRTIIERILSGQIENAFYFQPLLHKLSREFPNFFLKYRAAAEKITHNSNSSPNKYYVNSIFMEQVFQIPANRFWQLLLTNILRKKSS